MLSLKLSSDSCLVLFFNLAVFPESLKKSSFSPRVDKGNPLIQGLSASEEEVQQFPVKNESRNTLNKLEDTVMN